MDSTVFINRQVLCRAVDESNSLILPVQRTPSGKIIRKMNSI